MEKNTILLDFLLKLHCTQIVPQKALKILMVFHHSFVQVMNGRHMHVFIVMLLDASM